jgi:hypothetical protein
MFVHKVFIIGINLTEAWDEPKHNYLTDSKITYNKETESEYKQNNQLLNRNNYWESDREVLLERDDWYSLKSDREQHNNYAPLLMLNNSQFSNRVMSPTVSNCSKTAESRVDSAITNETSSESNFRRYARINDSEFDLNALHQKRVKVSEYRRALAQQKEEKQRKKLEDQERIRNEEELLEKRVREERLRMKNEYEREQKLIKEKREIAERKREAVIAAIEKTPIIKKRNFLVDKESDQTNHSPQQSLVTVATIRPQARTKEIFVQTDKQSFSQNCDIGTQTDVQLLLRLLQEMSYSSKEKPKTSSDPNEAISSDSSSLTTPKIHRKSNQNHKSKGLQNSLAKKPIWGTNNQQIKSYIKNTDKYPNRKLQEMRKKFKEKGNQIQTPIIDKEVNKEKRVDENAIASKSSVKFSDDIRPQPLSLPLRRNSLIQCSSARNISQDNNQKRMSFDSNTKLNFLPQISARPHSRKKWYSQETFNPQLLN